MSKVSKANAILYLYAETPLHVGTGSGLGAVDMPIQREKHTAFPIVQASGVKGSMRDTTEINIKDTSDIISIFGGSSGSDEETHAGAMSPSDARILCFPVRALNGVFVWVSSQTVLERYRLETGQGPSDAIPSSEKALVTNHDIMLNSAVMLEEFTYSAEEHPVAQAWAEHLANQLFKDNKYWHERLQSHFIILPDNEFRDFVRYSTEIVTRIAINSETKVVKTGALFTQELLPADSILYSCLNITHSRDGKLSADEVYTKLQETIGTRIQIGGDETVGRGRMRLAWHRV